MPTTPEVPNPAPERPAEARGAAAERLFPNELEHAQWEMLRLLCDQNFRAVTDARNVALSQLRSACISKQTVLKREVEALEARWAARTPATLETIRGEAREMLAKLEELNRELVIFDARLDTSQTQAEAKRLNAAIGNEDAVFWENFAYVLGAGLPPEPRRSTQPASARALGLFTQLRETQQTTLAICDHFRAQPDTAVQRQLADTTFMTAYKTKLADFRKQEEEYKTVCKELGSDTLRQICGPDATEAVWTQMLQVFRAPVAAPDTAPGFATRDQGAKDRLQRLHGIVSENQRLLSGRMDEWFTILASATPEQMQGHTDALRQLRQWMGSYLYQLEEYRTLWDTNRAKDDAVKSYLKMLAVEVAEESAETFGRFDGKPAWKVTKPLVQVTHIVDIALERSLIGTQRVLAEVLLRSGVQKVPNMDKLLRQFARSPIGYELLKSAVTMESKVTVLLWALHMQSSDNKLEAALQWSGFLVTSHMSDRMLTAAGATLERAGFGAIARIPGHPAFKFFAATLIMFGFAKEFTDFTKGLEETCRYEIFGPETTGSIETLLSTISGDALLNRIGALVNDSAFLHKIGVAYYDPIRQQKQFLQNRQLEGRADNMLDYGLRYTRTFDDWNRTVQARIDATNNPVVKRLYELEKVNPGEENTWARREAAKLRGAARNAWVLEGEIKRMVGASTAPAEVKTAATQLNLADVAVDDASADTNELAVQKRLEALLPLKRYLDALRPTNPEQTMLKMSWQTYRANIESIARDVRLYRHLTNPETDQGPGVRRIAYSKRDWVGDLSTGVVPPFAQQGLADELAYQIRRREALSIPEGGDASMRAFHITSAVNDLQINPRVTAERIILHDFGGKVSQFIDDLRKLQFIRRMLTTSEGDFGQMLYDELRALNSTAQAAARELESEDRARIFGLVNEQLVLPRTELEAPELLRRIGVVRKAMVDAMVAKRGGGRPIDAGWRTRMNIPARCIAVSNATDEMHLHHLGRAFLSELRDGADIISLSIVPSDRGAWPMKVIRINALGTDRKRWEVIEATAQHSLVTGYRFDQSVTSTFEAWSAANVGAARALEPQIRELEERKATEARARETVDARFARERDAIRADFIRVNEAAAMAGLNNVIISRRVAVRDRRTGQESFVDVPVGNAKELLDQINPEIARLEKEINDNCPRIATHWDRIRTHMQDRLRVEAVRKEFTDRGIDPNTWTEYALNYERFNGIVQQMGAERAAQAYPPLLLRDLKALMEDDPKVITALPQYVALHRLRGFRDQINAQGPAALRRKLEQDADRHADVIIARRRRIYEAVNGEDRFRDIGNGVNVMRYNRDGFDGVLVIKAKAFDFNGDAKERGNHQPSSDRHGFEVRLFRTNTDFESFDFERDKDNREKGLIAAYGIGDSAAFFGTRNDANTHRLLRTALTQRFDESFPASVQRVLNIFPYRYSWDKNHKQRVYNGLMGIYPFVSDSNRFLNRLLDTLETQVSAQGCINDEVVDAIYLDIYHGYLRWGLEGSRRGNPESVLQVLVRSFGK